MGSFSLSSKIQGKCSPKGGVSHQFQCKGNKTVSKSIHWPVSEIDLSDITQPC